MTLARYLGRLFVARFLTVLAGLAAVLQLVDLMDRSDEIVERGLGAAGMVRYALLRLPLVTAPAVPIAILAAAVLTFAALAWRGEIAAMRAAGVAVGRLVSWLLPAALAAALLGLVVADRLAPVADDAFAGWWAATDPAPGAGGRVWFRAGLDVVGARVAAGGHRLEDVELYRRDAAGRLVQVVWAPAAWWRDGGWWLAEAETRGTGGTAAAVVALRWPQGVPPANLRQLARREPVLSSATMRKILDGDWAGDRPPEVYRQRLARAGARPVMGPVMILLATPVARGLRRNGGVPAGMAVGLAAGLSYLLLDGILAALGEAGLLPPLLAAWLAHAVFASLGGAMLLHAEG